MDATNLVVPKPHAQWLTSLNPRQEVECFLGHRFLTLYALKRWEEGLECLLAAERYNPRSKPLHDGLRNEVLQNIARRDGLPPRLRLWQRHYWPGSMFGYYCRQEDSDAKP